MTDERLQTELDRVLRAERPVPRPTFRAGLKRRLMGMMAAGVGRPRQLGLMIAAYAGSGLLLLAVAFMGLLGRGPFAPG